MKNTQTQQEAMRNDYTFGVEIEMNHITRKDAAMLAAGFFGEEFETARTILLRNMDGNAAWHNA